MKNQIAFCLAAVGFLTLAAGCQHPAPVVLAPQAPAPATIPATNAPPPAPEISTATARQLRFNYILAAQPPFELKARQEAVLHAEECWQPLPNQDGWDIELRREDAKLFFDYSYAPCSLTHLGAGKLEDFLATTAQADTGDFPEAEEIKHGHVYLLHQGYWGHWILFAVTAE